MAVQTTFSMFQELLKDSINANSSLSSTMAAALLLRVDALPKYEPHALTAQNVNAITGGTVDEATDSITVPSGSGAEITWDLISFSTPVRIEGVDGPFGVLVGHVGQGSNSPVANADITLQYRETTTGTWRSFTRNTVLDEVSSVQFKATVGTQGADADMPQLHVIAEQL